MPKIKVSFIGRSNVGKSSLINYLLGQGLAKTSKQPGKTRKHDLFKFSVSIDFVDMPGYGFTKSRGGHRDLWDDAMVDLFFHDEQFRHLFLLIDSSITPLKIDKEFLTWLIENQVMFSIIFTKTDKAKAKEIQVNIDSWTNFINLLPNAFGVPNYFKVSVVNKQGETEIKDFLNELEKQELSSESVSE